MKNKHWCEGAIAYQIYPRSFKDSNGDGIGDLRGVIEKLDYIKELGVDIIWICPFYKSPNADNGYDISDYKDIMDEFGTMADCDELLEEVHKRDMKLIIDLVINHTSDEHEWFIESKSDRNSEKRDWYIWKDAKMVKTFQKAKGLRDLKKARQTRKRRRLKEYKEPNNWASIFKGSAWEYDEATEQYYLHLFDKKQPDLNFENPDMREALYEMINWWLDKGIDGFRIDAISHIKKDLTFSDNENPENEPYAIDFKKISNVEGIGAFLNELKEKTYSNYDVMTVGEANGVSVEEASEWAGSQDGYFNMIFQFSHLHLWNEEKGALDVVALKKNLTEWQNTLHSKGWNALFIENHDLARVVNRWGNTEAFWKASAKSIALMYFMQEGTPFIYQGQEIGMTNVHVDEIEEYQEAPTILTYYENLEKGLTKEEAMRIAFDTTRANSRTPMQWDESENAGFTTGKPWMKLNENYKQISVARQEQEEDSILNFYKQMIRIRKTEPELVFAEYNLLMPKDTQVYAYERVGETATYLVICNLTETPATFTYDTEITGKLLIATHETNHIKGESIDLLPYEARMYKLKSIEG